MLPRSPDGEIYVRAWEQVREAITLFAQRDDIKSIGIDDITTLSEVALTYVLWSNNHLGQSPTQPEWGRQMQIIRDVLHFAFAMRKHVAATAHQQYRQEEGTGRGWMLPLTTGKLADALPGIFDEVYHASTELVTSRDGKRSTRYLWQTRADRIYTAKSRLGMLGLTESVEDVTVERVERELPEDVGFRRIMRRVEEFRAKRGGGAS